MCNLIGQIIGFCCMLMVLFDLTASRAVLNGETELEPSLFARLQQMPARKRAINPFIDSIGKRSAGFGGDISKRYFDALAGQSLGKRSPQPFSVDFDADYA